MSEQWVCSAVAFTYFDVIHHNRPEFQNIKCSVYLGDRFLTILYFQSLKDDSQEIGRRISVYL